jgi:hypothetical protein
MVKECMESQTARYRESMIATECIPNLIMS